MYIDLISDNLYTDEDMPALGLNKKIFGLDLNYNGEARFAEVIEISKGRILCEDGIEEHYIKAKIKNRDQNCFEAKVILKTIK
jgi:hypothetical protein